MDEKRATPYPVMLDVSGRLAVVVGGDPAAVRTATSLARHGADVVVITPDNSPELAQMEADGLITIEPRGYVRGDLAGAAIAIAASGSAETDAAIVAEARERNVLVNVRSDRAASSFIVPSVVRRGDLQIAVSTAGTAPSVSREVKRGIAESYGAEWGTYAAIVAELRALAIGRAGMSEPELAGLMDFVTRTGVVGRLQQGETVTAKQIYADYAASLARQAAGEEAPEG